MTKARAFNFQKHDSMNRIQSRKSGHGIAHASAVAAMLTTTMMAPASSSAQLKFTDPNVAEGCGGFSSIGRNPFFILEPGYQLELAGTAGGKAVRVSITVLNRTRTVNGVETRVVLERKTIDGELFEVSKNYFAVCDRDDSVFYFGDNVNLYVDGFIVGHDGSWRAGVREHHAKDRRVRGVPAGVWAVASTLRISALSKAIPGASS